MLHSFFSSRFYSLTVIGTVAFAVAAVLMMGFLHSKVQQTFLDATRTYHLQSLSALCKVGCDTIESHLTLVEQELRTLAKASGRDLRKAGHQQRGPLLEKLQLHAAEAYSFLFLDKPCSCLVNAGMPPHLADAAMKEAWLGYRALVGPYFDDAGNFLFCMLVPTQVEDTVIGVLAVQLDAEALSSWIRPLSAEGIGGTACVLTSDGNIIASALKSGGQRIRAHYLEAQRGETSDEMEEMRIVRAAQRGSGGQGSYELHGEKIFVAYRDIARTPWTFAIGFKESVLSKQVSGTANMALRGSFVYFVVLVGGILVIVGLTLFDAVRNHRLSLMLAEQNATISRQAENLLASERMFRYTLTQSCTQVIDYDVTSRMLTFYSGLEKDVFYISEEDDWGKLLLRDKEISREALAEIRMLVRDVLSGAARESCDFRLRDKTSGREQWHRLSLSGLGGEEGAAPRRLVGIIEDISEAKEAEYDLLTRLYNRKTTEEIIRQRLAVRPSSQPYAFLLLDVDRFKSVNDTFGHPIGDKVLEETAELLRATFREGDVLGRLGGDEFCVFLSGEHLEKSRLESALSSLHRNAHDILKGPSGESPAVSFSCGVVFSRTRHSFEELYQLADEALYRVKEAGRDNFEIVCWEG